MEQLRTFVAIELPDELRQALAELQERLKAGSRAPVKWVDPGGIHLTLKFLGNISPGLVGRITSALGDAARNTGPILLEAKDLGAFPNLRRVQVVWVGVGGEVDRLGRLQQRIEAALKPLGFTPESRAFTAHLTLARVRDRIPPDEGRQLGQLIAETRFDACSIEVDAIHLMRSQLTPRGAIYSCLASVSL